MRNFFKLTTLMAAVACSSCQSANAGLLGMPLNLHHAIAASNSEPVAAVPTPAYPRYVDDVFAGTDAVIAC